MTTFPPFESVFHRVFDVIVFGAGYIGFSAARTLAAEGRQVLLTDASVDLLWESNRALENTLSDSNDSSAWCRWVQRLKDRQGIRGTFFDAALAEVLAAHDLEHALPELSTLLYAMPVALTTDSSGITTVTVATKSGFRQLRARQWIDATENGSFVRLCVSGGSLASRLPSETFRGVVLQSSQWEILCEPLNQFLQTNPRFELLRSVRETERRLRWLAPSQVPWYEDILAVVGDLRAQLSTAPFLVSHSSRQDFPVYSSTSNLEAPALPANLLVLSPALRAELLCTVEDRFVLGSWASRYLPSQQSNLVDDTFPLRPSVSENCSCDVLVAGTGTAGVLAALVASQQGAQTLAVDFAQFPGGQGCEGGITGYCHGNPGGMQTRLDALTEEISNLLTGASEMGVHWQHLGKRLAILKLLAEAGVHFQGETLLCDVERGEDGRLEAVLVAIDGRIIRIAAKSFIDSSGDGDLCALAGAEFSHGRPGDGRCLSFSQVGFALRKTDEGFTSTSCNYDAGWVDATNPEDLSRARLKGLAQYLRETWTEEGRPFALAPVLGLRQSRQICTELSVTLDDLITGATFPDTVGETLTFADTHSVDLEFESDEAMFYYWGCQCFRHQLRCDLPYRMLLPKGLPNVWIACRAAGMQDIAAYGIRMQRDIQRLGEAAGIAAALASRSDGCSRSVDISALHALLQASGACSRTERTPANSLPLARLAAGDSGIHLWQIYRQPETFRADVEMLLCAENPDVSFRSAALLAMWGSHLAEPRMLSAIASRAQGPPSPESDRGAFGEEIHLPFWLLAVVLLRRCGTARCLPALRELAAQPNMPFNVITCLALTLERLAKPENASSILEIQRQLMESPLPNAHIPPSRSVRRALDGRPQVVFYNNTGADTRDDHTWQLHLIVARTRIALNLPPQPESESFLCDSRCHVREAFRAIAAPGCPRPRQG